MKELLVKLVTLVDEATALIREERKRRSSPYQWYFGQQVGNQSLGQQNVSAYQQQGKQS